MLTLPPRLSRWANYFKAAQLCFGVPEDLMAAIVDRESLGGDALKPKGPAGTGDGGAGHGLAQIDYRFHRSFLLARMADAGATPMWTVPAFNILYGAWLLNQNYQIAKSWPVAVAAYNAGLTKALRVYRALPDGRTQTDIIKAVDMVTTGGNYVSDVWRRRAEYTAGTA